MAKMSKEKIVVAQDNRFVFAKYDMNANELKFFMWIIGSINSVKEEAFRVCEIPTQEIFGILDQKYRKNYTYIRSLCESMLKKTYIEDFKILDEKTMKDVRVFQGYTLFEFISYKEGEGRIIYKLNESLTQYLLNLKGNFTKLNFTDIQKMKSSYSIRIYNMLLSELKQNRRVFQISLAVLQNILEVPKSLREKWNNFKRVVLDQTIKDVNTKTNMLIFSIDPIKDGRKIIALKFNFDYKGNEEKIKRDNIKRARYIDYLAEKEISPLLGKRVCFDVKTSIFKISSFFRDNTKKFILYSYRIRQDKEGLDLIIQDFNTKKEFIFTRLNSYEAITFLKKCVKRGEELSCLDKDNLKRIAELRFKQ